MRRVFTSSPKHQTQSWSGVCGKTTNRLWLRLRWLQLCGDGAAAREIPELRGPGTPSGTNPGGRGAKPQKTAAHAASGCRCVISILGCGTDGGSSCCWYLSRYCWSAFEEDIFLCSRVGYGACCVWCASVCRLSPLAVSRRGESATTTAVLRPCRLCHLSSRRPPFGVAVRATRGLFLIIFICEPAILNPSSACWDFR